MAKSKWRTYNARDDDRWKDLSKRLDFLCGGTGLQKGDAVARSLDYCVSAFEKGNLSMIGERFVIHNEDKGNGITE